MKAKLLYTILLSVVLLCVALLFGCTDPVYAVVDYLITPVLAIGRLVLFLLISLIVDVLRRGKNAA